MTSPLRFGEVRLADLLNPKYFSVTHSPPQRAGNLPLITTIEPRLSVIPNAVTFRLTDEAAHLRLGPIGYQYQFRLGLAYH